MYELALATPTSYLVQRRVVVNDMAKQHDLHCRSTCLFVTHEHEQAQVYGGQTVLSATHSIDRILLGK